MAFLGVIFLCLAPYLVGALILAILREKTQGMVVTYATGLLSLFVYFFACILIALKLDWTLVELERIFIYPILVLAFAGIFFARRNITVIGKIEVNDLLFIVPALLLFLYTYIYLCPSIVNDDTWDIVSVTLANRTLYTNSAMTGLPMVKGLPIFNKIYIMPMFIACLCDYFSLSAEAVIKYILPLIVFALNILLVYKIAKETETKKPQAFMIIYMMLLMAGTYLPEKGIPITLGYAILREGYSGYAFAYGVMMPLVVLLLLKKKKLHALLMCISAVGLLRLDRIFYALKTPIASFKAINTEGKIVALYFAAVIVVLIFKYKEKQSSPLPLMLLPSVLITYEAVKISELLKGKKEKYFYFLGLSVIIFSTCSFSAFHDAFTNIESCKYEQKATEILEAIDDRDAVIWTDTELCGYLHRADGNVKTLYGRNVGNLSMDGLDYEDKLEDIDTFYHGYYNLIDRNTFFDMETSVVELLGKLQPLCDYIVFPINNLNDNIYTQLETANYTEFATTDNFKIYSTNR